jgi:hypothetical protein
MVVNSGVWTVIEPPPSGPDGTTSTVRAVKELPITAPSVSTSVVRGSSTTLRMVNVTSAGALMFLPVMVTVSWPSRSP